MDDEIERWTVSAGAPAVMEIIQGKPCASDRPA